MNNDTFTVLVSEGGRCHWVSMCNVWPSHSKWLSEWSNKSASNFALSLNVPPQNYSDDSEGHSYGQLVIGSFIMKTWPLIHHILCQVFWLNIESPKWLSPTSAQIWHLWLMAFPKIKFTFEKEENSDCQWDSGKYDRAADVTGRTMWGPKVPILKGTEASLSYVQCFLYLLSSSINVFIFHITCLHAFWTDLICNIQAISNIKTGHGKLKL